MTASRNKAKPAISAPVALAILLVVGMAAHGIRTPPDPNAAIAFIGGANASERLSSAGQSIGRDLRDPVRETLERLSEHELKAFYARCSGQSIKRRLDGGEAMACSIGYEILLRNFFGGDFEVFLAWSRAQARTPPY